MGDASMSIEQGMATGEQSIKPVIPETHQQEVVSPLPQHIDLDRFYQEEVARFRAEQVIPGKKAWDVLEKTAKERSSSGEYLQEELGTAQSPNLKSEFPPELAQKIDTLSRVLNMKVGDASIDQLQTIINNPDYLDFVAYLAENKVRMHGDRVPILDNIVAFDKAGVLKPVVNIYRFGVLLNLSTYSDSEITHLFMGYNDYSPQEMQQTAIKHMQFLLSRSLRLEEFLQDPQKQEFVGLLSHLKGENINVHNLFSLERIFGKGLSRKKEAIYVLKFMQGSKEKSVPDFINIELDDLGRISDSQKIMEGLTDKDFPVFLQTLQEKIGYMPDFSRYKQDRTVKILVDIFVDPILRQGLLKESTVKIIKTFHPKGDLNPLLMEDYIQLGNNPNVLQTIHALTDLRLRFSVEDLKSVANNPDTLGKITSPEYKSLLARLKSYNYEFGDHSIEDIPNLISLLESPDKEHIFQTLDLLKESFQFSYKNRLLPYYIRLAQIPDVENKILEAGASIAPEDLLQRQNFELFVILGGNSGHYNHAKKLLLDDYFNNIRDAQNRLFDFKSDMYAGMLSEAAVAKLFALSQKATELDRLVLKFGINAEIARLVNRDDWYGSLLQTSSFQEANEELTRLMIDLALPMIYSDLQGEDLARKQNELAELSSKDKEFDTILEICCRSVGIYGKEYPSKGSEFATLMDGIRQSLELNLERNPKAYLEKRAELSSSQFDRIFEGFPQDVKERSIRTWLDLSSRRRLRVSGTVVTTEEATLNRLNRIKDVVQTDLSVHLKDLFLAKIKELDQAAKRGDANGLGVEQLDVYKQYLLTPEGTVRQDIPRMYRSIETFMHSTQQALRNPGTPKEEKARLGKSLGTYQAISDSLKSLYRLGTISEKRYKARRDYLNEVDKHIGEFSGALRRLRILDPERRSADTNIRALENEVLLDFGKLKETMAEEGIQRQVIFETESTVSFGNLARAPEMNQSCQRLTEVTGYNQAAYSRLLDGNNEMIDIFELRNGEKNRLARSFIELSRIKLTDEEQPRLAVLLDREYVNPQYQDFDRQFSTEMVSHMLDRITGVPELSLILNTNRFFETPEVEVLLRSRGYRVREVSGEYFINESNLKLKKYYDSLNGLTDVTKPSYEQFTNFYLIEKA